MSESMESGVELKAWARVVPSPTSPLIALGEQAMVCDADTCWVDRDQSGVAPTVDSSEMSED